MVSSLSLKPGGLPGPTLRLSVARCLFGDETVDGHVHEIGIAQEFRAVGVGELHGFGHEMDGVGGVVAEVADGKGFEQVQDLDEVDAAGTGRGHGVDVIPSVGAVDGLADDGAVACKVLHGDETAVRFHGVRDGFGDLAFVKAAGAGTGDGFEAFGKVFLDEFFADLIAFAALLVEDLHGRGPLGHAFFRVTEREEEVGVHGEAVFGEFDGGLYGALEGDGAVFFEGERQPGDGPGDAGGEQAVSGFFGVGVAFVVKEHVAEGFFGGFFAVVDGDGLAG